MAEPRGGAVSGERLAVSGQRGLGGGQGVRQNGAQGVDGPDPGVEPLVVPESGEVETDGGGLGGGIGQLAGDPEGAAIGVRMEFGEGGEAGDGEGGFLDTSGHAGSAAPTAVGIL